MSIEKCLNAKVEAGVLSREKAEEALESVRRIEKRYAKEMSQSAAEAAAAAETARVMAEIAERRKRQRGLQILITKKGLDRIDEHPNGPAAGFGAILSRDIFEKSANANAFTRAEIILGDLARRWNEGLAAYKPRLAGLRQNTIGMRTFIRELYGERTGDPVAANAAKAWRDTTDHAAKRYAAAGGEILERDDWRLPQSHNANRIRKAPDQWASDIRDAFERGDLDVLDFATGERVNAAQFETLLVEARAHIISRVEANRIGGHPGNRALPRMFHWKTSKAWLAYNDRWGAGRGGIYGLVAGHLERISKDISLTETLGPYHGATVKQLRDHVVEAESHLPNAHPLFLTPHRIVSSPDATLRAYRHMNGELSTPVSELISGFFNGLRGFLTVAQLGSAIISAVPSDTATLLIAARNNDIPFLKVVNRTVRLLANNKADLATASRIGVIAEAVRATAIGTRRFGDDMLGPGFGSRVADFVIRASGLAHWTQAAKTAFMMEFSGLLADQASRPYSKVRKGLRRAFKRYGITSKEWDQIRRSKFLEGPHGATFLDPTAIEDKALAEKVMGMIIQERAYAVVEPDSRVRGTTTLGTRSGTLAGEIPRSVAMYKSFSISIMLTTATRTIYRLPEYGGLGGPVTRSAAWAGLMTILLGAGALSIQTRQIVSGKDPRDMSDPDFWAASLFQAGGGGIFGDLVQTGVSRADQGAIATLAGPVAGFAEDSLRLGVSNIRQAIEGQPTNFGAEAARFARRYFPGGNLWFGRKVLDAALFDQLQTMIDPNYRQSWNRIAQKMQQRYNQEAFWPPGQTLPARAPDLEAAFGQ